MGSGATPAVRALVSAGVAHDVHTYHHDPKAAAYGTEAAEALGVDPAAVFKTLVIELADARLAVAVVPVSGTLSLKSAASALGSPKAVMADPAKAQRTTGCVLGGISPLGQKKRLPTVIDSSALDHETVYCSAGKRGMEVELAPGELVRLTDAVTAAIGVR